MSNRATQFARLTHCREGALDLLCRLAFFAWARDNRGMFREILAPLWAWSAIDTWTVVTAALAAMACALPGNYLVLRRQSMMGDALSHTALPGIVLAFLFASWLKGLGWISPETYDTWRHAFLFAGAVGIGIVSALLTEWVQQLGRVETSAALGVVFTSLFALGLLLVRAAADNIDLDPDCVLYGTIETVIFDTWGSTSIPRAAVTNGAVFAANLLLILLLYKELKISTFDPALATILGINARAMHYGLMAVTAMTLVAAFESVGSILVIAMLIVPASTANLLTNRLSRMIGLSLVVACLSALLGHVMAITLPGPIFSRLGFTGVRDASTAGMMAAATGMLFVGAVFFAPRSGLISRSIDRLRLSLRIASEDVLGTLYRREELASAGSAVAMPSHMPGVSGVGRLTTALATWGLRRRGRITVSDGVYRLTEGGRKLAQHVIRSHRLWETYVAKHFVLPEDHVHGSAERIEHYLDDTLRQALEKELDRPSQDPQGHAIPPEA